GGGILTHGIPVVHHGIEQLTAQLAASSGILAALLPTLLNALAGIVAGAIALVLVSLATRLWKTVKKPAGSA
ncbi:MAG TPA: DUF808 domain-containing protein, partial [Pseudomonas sp.]|nr:DUF808 domain-containing protein [Pseudomonas sp.]